MQRMQIMLALLVAIISFPEAQGGALGMLYGIFGQQEYGSTNAVSNQALPSPTSQESTTNSARWAAAARDKKLSFGVDLQLKTRMEAASKYLSMLEEDEGSPCGHNTVMALLESGCHNLRDSTRMQIALKFANCHLHKAGLATYECDMSQTSTESSKPKIEKCVRKIGQDAVAYGTYSLFYTNVEAICFYSQSQHFQEVTERAVHSLFEATVTTADHLNTFSRQSEIHMEVIRETMEEEASELKKGFEFLNTNQEQLQDSQKALKDDIQKQHEDLSSILNNSTSELHGMLLDALAVQEIANEQLEAIRSVQTQVKAGVAAALTAHKELQGMQATSAQRQKAMLHNEQELLKGQEGAKQEIFNLRKQQEKARDLVIESQVKLEKLLSAQKKAFAATEASLDSILEKTSEAERSLLNILEPMRENLSALLAIDKLILGEFFYLQSIAYFVSIAFLAFTLTSFRRTSRARFAVFSFILVNICAESYVRSNENFIAEFISGGVILEQQIAKMRQIFGLMEVLAMVYFAATFKDYEKMNYHLLKILLAGCRKNKQVDESDADGLQLDELSMDSQRDWNAMMMNNAKAFSNNFSNEDIFRSARAARSKGASSKIIAVEKREKENAMEKKANVANEGGEEEIFKTPIAKKQKSRIKSSAKKKSTTKKTKKQLPLTSSEKVNDASNAESIPSLYYDHAESNDTPRRRSSRLRNRKMGVVNMR